MAKISKIYKYLREVAIIKTIWFNLHYFPFKIACRLPFFIYRYTLLSELKGHITIENNGGKVLIKSGLVKIGARHVGVIDNRYERTIWLQEGELVINGPCEFGSGSKISIGKDGILNLGSHFMISGGSTIICQNNISFGSNCLLSWDVQVMDTDFHKIYDKEGNLLNT